MYSRLLSLVILLVACSTADTIEAINNTSEPLVISGPVQLQVPLDFYATTKVPLRIYLQDLVLDANWNQLEFRLILPGEVITTTPTWWEWTPTSNSDHVLTVVVRNDVKLLASAKANVHVVQGIDSVRILTVGDSLTAPGMWQSRMRDNLIATGTSVELVGSQGSDSLHHEGRSGRKWSWFAGSESPFWYNGSLDFGHYVSTYLDSTPPTHIIFALGVNDVGLVSLSNSDAAISASITSASLLVDAIHATVPLAEIGIWLLPPGSSSDANFTANYGTGPGTAWNHKQVQHKYVKQTIIIFGNREEENISLIPTNLVIDPSDYPIGHYSGNALHPTIVGQYAFGDVMASWVRFHHEE